MLHSFSNVKSLSLHKLSVIPKPRTINTQMIIRDEPAFPKAVIQSTICHLANHDCDDGQIAELETGRLAMTELHNQPNRKEQTAFKRSSAVSYLYDNKHGKLVTGATGTS